MPFVSFSHLPCYNQAGKEVIQLAKTDKELAVELMGSYLTGLYSAGNMKPLDPESIKKILQAFYDAVKSVTD